LYNSFYLTRVKRNLSRQLSLANCQLFTKLTSFKLYQLFGVILIYATITNVNFNRHNTFYNTVQIFWVRAG